MTRTEIAISLQGKKVTIWGARMTGLGTCRFLAKFGVRPSFFIDSDPGLKNFKVAGLRVISPTEDDFSKRIDEIDVVLLAVVLKESDIISELLKLGVRDRVEVISFQDSLQPSYTIDILGSCNLKCGSCPHSIVGHAVPRGSMALPIFRQVFEKVMGEAPELTHLSLYSWGEPLIHPDIVKMIDLVHRAGVAVALSSNFSLDLDSILPELVKSGPDYLKISVSGFTQPVYETTHQGGDIRLVKSNLYRLRYLMDKYRRDFMVDVNYHLYSNNCNEELASFKAFCRELGFILSETYSLVMPLERVEEHLAGAPDYNTRVLNDSLLLVDIDEGIRVSGGAGLGPRPCPYRENQVNVNADLSVPICCLTFGRGERTIVADNYLLVNAEDISDQKRLKEICTNCQKNGLQEYNLGFNRAEWDRIAGGRGYHPSDNQLNP